MTIPSIMFALEGARLGKCFEDPVCDGCLRKNNFIIHKTVSKVMDGEND